MESVAYLVLCHALDEQLDLLLDTLTSDPRSHVYVHLDGKVDADRPVKGAAGKPLQNTFIGDRCRVNWGGYSVVEATLKLLRTALQNPKHTRFVLISAACFPVASPEITNDKIEQIDPGLFSVWGRINPELRKGEGHGRYVVSKFHPFDWERINPKRGIFFERGWSFYKKLAAKVPLERKVSVANLWKGSQFFVAARELAEFLAQPHPELSKALKYALAPDEVYFNTLFVRYLHKRGKKVELTDPDISEQGTHFITKRVPAFRTVKQKLLEPVDLRRLSVEDVASVQNGNALFARKCSPAVSRAMMSFWHTPQVEERRPAA